MSLMKDKSMKRKLIGSSDHDDRNDSNAEKKRRRKNAVETPKHCPLSERQQVALLMQMTSVENSPEPASPPPSIRRTPGGSGRKDRVHRRNERGETQLHLSTIKGDLEAMKELIKQGAEVNVQDFAGWTPLHEACNHGHQEITSYLLEVGANVNSKGLEDDTPLHDAVTNSHRDLVELLLKHGANPLLKNKRGERPLDIAEDPVIQELMQKEVISDESDSEMDVPSPIRSESSLESRKFVSKIRTTSSSSSNRELFKNENRSDIKKRRKSKNGFTKITPLTSSDSSSDSSDSSDDSSLPDKLHDSTPNTPLSNENGRSSVKAPSLSATPLKFPNFSLKKKQKKEGSSKLSKTTVPMSKTARSDLATSSDASSDSEKRIRRKDINDDHNQGFFSKGDRREHTKGKSLYYNDKTLFQGQSAHNYHKNKPSLSELPSKAKQLSIEKEAEHKNKTHGHSDEPTLKSSSQKVNGCLNFNSTIREPDTSSYPKKKTAESVYDFSLSTEDSTNIGAISLKPKSKDKASELFDALCLGKPSQIVKIENKDNIISKAFEVNHHSLKNKISAPKPQEKDDYFQLTIANTKEQNESGLDKNHNKIVGHNSVKLPHACFGSKEKSTSQSPVEKKPHVFAEKSPVEKKPVIFPAKHVASKDIQETTVEADTSVNKVKSETKLDKKVKKSHASLDSPKKHATGAPPASSKVDSVKKISSDQNKKQLIKVEHIEDGKTKHKTLDLTREVKCGNADNVGSSSAKKKKKHKHSKHLHDHTNPDSKHKTRVTSSEVVSSNMMEKDKLHGKTLLKRSDSIKTDSVKPQSVPIPRKSSHEGKAETVAAFPARKKVRSTDSTGSETSVKTSKHNSSSVPKSAQERQVTSNSTKKDKPEIKKKALLSDSFLSELEKSSLQREKERKLKQKRKKKLLQQQKLKLKVQSGSAPKDLKLSSTPGNAVNTGDKSVTPFFPSEFHPVDHGRRSSVSTENTGASSQSTTQHSGDFGFPPVPHQGVTDDQSRPFQGYFRSLPLAARSNSQVDTRVGNLPSEVLKQGEQLPYNVHDKRHHLPVQRSLSFSNPTLDDTTHGMNLPFRPEASRHIQHDVAPQLHSVDATTDGIRQNYPAISNSNMGGASSDSKFIHFQNIEPNQNIADRQPISAVPSGQPISGLLPSDPDNTIVAEPLTFDSDSGTKLIASETKGVAVNPVHDMKTGEDGMVEGNASEVKASENAETMDPGNKDEISEGQQPPAAQTVESSDSPISKEETERKILLENYVKERLSQLKAVIEEPEPKRLPVFIPLEKLKRAKKDPMQDRLNVYEEWSIIQDQTNERRKKYSTVVIPQAPQSYWEYMTFTGGYLLSGSRESWLSVPVLAPPPSLNEETHSLFTEQEKERVKLRLQHATQREKLIVACEQEIMRVHSRAARTLQNQQIPLSACSVLLDREIYNVERRNKKVSEESNTNRTASIRDRFNTRMFLSWLQDVDDKYRKMKNVLLARQRHEAQALHAVQRTEWLLKLQEGDRQGQQRWSNTKPEEVNQLHVPLVNISDDFDLLPR